MAPAPRNRQAPDHRTLVHFVRRARRLAACSLIDDPEQVAEKLHEEPVLGEVGGRQAWGVWGPPEDALDSASVRLRPFLKSARDDIEFARVMTYAIGIVGDDASAREFADLRQEWNVASKHSPFAITRIDPEGFEVDQTLTASQLSEAWLNGDLVHSDNDAVDSTELVNRYVAAFRAFLPLIGIVERALDLVEKHQDVLGLRGHRVWAEPVSIPRNESGYVVLSEAVASVHALKMTSSVDDPFAVVQFHQPFPLPRFADRGMTVHVHLLQHGDDASGWVVSIWGWAISAQPRTGDRWWSRVSRWPRRESADLQ